MSLLLRTAHCRAVKTGNEHADYKYVLVLATLYINAERFTQKCCFQSLLLFLNYYVFGLTYKYLLEMRLTPMLNI